MIGVRQLSKSFGRLAVLRDIDITFNAGRVTGIVGPNAAGKTTLIKMLLGLAFADGGEILFDGTPIDKDPAYRARIGYMPQIARFPDNLTGAELLEMIADLRGVECPADDDLVARFRLSDELRKPLRTLSGGTRQKVNAAIAFMFNPDVLILDEPTAGLDPISSGVLKDRIVTERAAGKTIIITSHVMSELAEVADDVVCLVDAGVQFSGSVKDLMSRTREATLERALAKLMAWGRAA